MKIEAIFLLDLGVDPFFISNLGDLPFTLKLPWMVWFVDDPEGYGFPGVCSPRWTIAFCWDREICRQMNPGSIWEGRPLLYLPICTDPDIFSIQDSPSNISYPGGAFVGSSAHGNEWLSRVAETNPGFFDEVEDIWRIYQDDFRQELRGLAAKKRSSVFVDWKRSGKGRTVISKIPKMPGKEGIGRDKTYWPTTPFGIEPRKSCTPSTSFENSGKMLCPSRRRSDASPMFLRLSHFILGSPGVGERQNPRGKGIIL